MYVCMYKCLFDYKKKVILVISDKYYIRKFEEFHKQINKFVIDMILYNRKRNNNKWVSKAPTQAKPRTNFHGSVFFFFFFVLLLPSLQIYFSKVDKTRQI